MDNVGDITILHGDCRDVMKTLADGCVNLIVTDPPYYRVKMDEEWDRQWPTRDAYLAWIGELCQEWYRVLAPNGSLYVFASPEMAARVECKIGERFEVLNRITWRKPPFATKAEMFRKEDLRTFFPASEALIFAEQHEADSATPFGERIKIAREECGIRGMDLDIRLGYMRSKNPMRGTELCRRWEEGSSVPTVEDYCRALAACSDSREQTALLAEYEDLRRQYENLRRPFYVDDSVPYTDVWDFPTVSSRPDKHPCEKPLAMIEHIVAASSRPGNLILDCFSGSGVTGQACRNLGRRCILIEKDPHWVDASRIWLDRPHARIPREKVHKPMPLFAGLDPSRESL